MKGRKMQYHTLESKAESVNAEAESLGLEASFTPTTLLTKNEKPPFVAALGPALAEARPQLKAHFSHSPGVYRYQGVMQKVWRRGGWRGMVAKPFLKLVSRMEMLFAYTGEEIPFELINEVRRMPDGRLSMTWERLFYFPEGRQRFYAVMVYDPQRQLIIDYLGNQGQLEVELHTQICNEVVCVSSGRQWWRIGNWRLPFPKLLAGQAQVCEWQEGQDFCIRVVIQNPLLGRFFGYEGCFKFVGILF